MYLNILKRDLKRKKTMNIILLLFTILASLFVSSGLSNVVTIMNGTDYFLDKAGVGDYMVITQKGDGGVEKIVRNSECVSSYKKENCFWGTVSDIKINDQKVTLKNNTIVIQEFDRGGINYYNTDNTELTEVKAGEVYISVGVLEACNAKVGDSFKVKLSDIELELKIAGEIKDALLGSDMMGNTRFLISLSDAAKFKASEKLNDYKGNIFYIDTDDEKALSKELADANNILFDGNKGLVKTSYIMEMIVALIVLVLSACLCIVSFVLLKFVITFTINEEYREIGVMKAIGIKNLKIRSLYIAKYFALSVIGGIVGFIIGIPFGAFLLSAASKKMLLGNDSGIILNIIGTVIVVLIMIGFAFLCTGKVKKSTPVDAIRNGQTGERYNKKGKYSLRKAHTSNALYMAINDVVSAPRRFLTIILSFFICSVFVFGVVMVVDTMNSDSLIGTFGKKSDVYITDSDMGSIADMSDDGENNIDRVVKDIEEDMNKLGMPGKVSIEVGYKYPVTVGDDTTNITMQQNKYTKTTDYDYIEGSAPMNANEIAITEAISEKIGAKIGDKVTIDYGTEKRECIIVGYFQTMNQLGEVVRIHEDAPTSMKYASSMMGYQIDFNDHPDNKTVDERIKTIKDYYNTDAVLNAAEYCDDCMKVAGTMDAVAKLLLAITCVVVILVSVLMERTFISNEKNQIALLKAIGFKNSFVMRWQIYRFMIVAVLSEMFAILLTYPITRLWCDPIWNMMGASNVNYIFNPVSLLVIYPGIILAINLISVLFTARYTRTITSKDMANIE